MFGSALALLGLLDIGLRDINVLSTDEVSGTDPLYSKLLEHELPLKVVAVTYLLVYFGSLAVLRILHRRKGDVREEEKAHYHA